MGCWVCTLRLADYYVNTLPFKESIKLPLSSVLCSHGPVIPQIIAAAAATGGATIDGALRQSAALSTGEYSVLHFSAETETPRLVAVETHSPAAG